MQRILIVEQISIQLLSNLYSAFYNYIMNMLGLNGHLKIREYIRINLLDVNHYSYSH